MKYIYTCEKCESEVVINTDMSAPKKYKCPRCKEKIVRDDLKKKSNRNE